MRLLNDPHFVIICGFECTFLFILIFIRAAATATAADFGFVVSWQMHSRVWCFVSQDKIAYFCAHFTCNTLELLNLIVLKLTIFRCWAKERKQAAAAAAAAPVAVTTVATAQKRERQWKCLSRHLFIASPKCRLSWNNFHSPLRAQRLILPWQFTSVWRARACVCLFTVPNAFNTFIGFLLWYFAIAIAVIVSPLTQIVAGINIWNAVAVAIKFHEWFIRRLFMLSLSLNPLCTLL